MLELEQLLLDGTNLFVAKINDDLIGIATVRVGLGTTGTFVGLENPVSTTLFFRNVGTGDTHSFKTNYSVITGDVKKKLSYCFYCRNSWFEFTSQYFC